MEKRTVQFGSKRFRIRDGVPRTQPKPEVTQADDDDDYFGRMSLARMGLYGATASRPLKWWRP